MLQVNLDLPVISGAPFTTPQRELDGSLFGAGCVETLIGGHKRYCYRFMKVRVYRNLNKPEYFSIMAMEGADKGRVVAYAKSVLIENVSFRVSEASRHRVLVEKRRNVHAFCDATIVDISDSIQRLSEFGSYRVVTYNPYKMGAFYCRADDSPHTKGCDQAVLQGSDVHILVN